MTKEQVEEEYRKLLRETIAEENRIMKEAKENGTWKPGLDSNKELFVEVKKEFYRKIDELKNSVDE